MNAILRDVIETVVNVDAGLYLPANQLNGLKGSPGGITLWQASDVAGLGNSKDAACASEYVNLHCQVLCGYANTLS